MGTLIADTHHFTMAEDHRAVVIDCGSQTIKVGFAGDETPKYTYSTREEAGGKPPIKGGIVTDWSNFEKLLKASFRWLSVDPAKHPVLIVDHNLGLARSSTAREQRDRIARELFLTLSVPSLFIASSTKLASIASKKCTGVVVDCGDTVTDICCVYEGLNVEHTQTPIELAGRSLTNYAWKKMIDEGFLPSSTFRTSYGRLKDLARTMKEKCFYVALDVYEEKEKGTDREYFSLPGGEGSITLENERFCYPEILFQPRCGGFSEGGAYAEKFDDSIPEAVFDCILKCDATIRDDMYGNIILCGGTSLLPGFPERFEQEIRRLAPSSKEVNVVIPPNREYAAWIGGSMLASSDTFEQMVFTYEEFSDWMRGPKLIHSKFF